MLQRLPIALAQVKTWKTSKNQSNEICQIIQSLYQAKEVTEKVYNNKISLIRFQYKNWILGLWILKKVMPPNLIDLTDKRCLKRSDIYVVLSNLSTYYTGKRWKYKSINLNICLKDHILYQIFKIISSISVKNMKL